MAKKRQLLVELFLSLPQKRLWQGLEVEFKSALKLLRQAHRQLGGGSNVLEEEFIRKQLFETIPGIDMPSDYILREAYTEMTKRDMNVKSLRGFEISLDKHSVAISASCTSAVMPFLGIVQCRPNNKFAGLNGIHSPRQLKILESSQFALTVRINHPVLLIKHDPL